MIAVITCYYCYLRHHAYFPIIVGLLQHNWNIVCSISSPKRQIATSRCHILPLGRIKSGVIYAFGSVSYT
jgi:hypothetical protein